MEKPSSFTILIEVLNGLRTERRTIQSFPDGADVNVLIHVLASNSVTGQFLP